MNKINTFLAIVILILLITPMLSLAAEEKKAEKKFVTDIANEICPVMGTPVEKDLVVILDAKLIHVCCNYCVKELPDNYAKYADKVVAGAKENQKTYELVNNQICPVSQKPVDKKFFAIKGDKIYYFCCPDCAAKFNPEKDPVKAEKK